uniref:E3 ubiquitin-protein ligase RNF182-like n=1 Tax=Myxine glutinosa TaxID=7769 RepID=UPI00358FC011
MEESRSPSPTQGAAVTTEHAVWQPHRPSITSNSSRDDLECDICYIPFDLSLRRPKLLACKHIVCARCLVKIVAATNVSPIAADIETHVPCPFCRHGTVIRDACGVAALPEAQALLVRMHMRRQRLRLYHQHQMSEMILNTEGLNTSTAPTQVKDGLIPDDASSLLLHPVIWTSQESPPLSDSTSTTTGTILQSSSSGDYEQTFGIRAVTAALSSSSEMNDGSQPIERSEGMVVMSSGEIHHSSLCGRVPRILFWLLCLVYFSSLPLGIYLLVMERVSIGVALVNMLPATLVLCLIYGLCRWLCQEPCICCVL